VCDTLCMLAPGGALFAKNSDRPRDEVQLAAPFGRRAGGGALDTQYRTVVDTGAAATLLARPSWLWGAEHGVNEHRVAIGNERVDTRTVPSKDAGSLIGMDLVRLALERATDAEGAVDVIAELLAAHGQGGVADDTWDEAYFSSFLITDPASGWIVDTSGPRWAARPVTASDAISNRLSLRADWTRAAPDVPAGLDVDDWRDPAAPTGHADRRLGANRKFLAASAPDTLDPRSLVGQLRDHGHGPWGMVGAHGEPDPPPAELLQDYTGISVCMHVRGYMATTSSMVALLPRHPDRPLRAWVATGSPCVSVYLPAFPPQPVCPEGAVPSACGDERVWRGFARLRDGVEEDPATLAKVRALLNPIEDDLWAEADGVADSPEIWGTVTAEWSDRVVEVLERLGV
jgi:secernin